MKVKPKQTVIVAVMQLMTEVEGLSGKAGTLIDDYLETIIDDLEAVVYSADVADDEFVADVIQYLKDLPE